MQKWLILAEQHNIVDHVKTALHEIVGMHERLGKAGEADEYRKKILSLNSSGPDLPSSPGSSAIQEDNFPTIDIESLNISDALTTGKTVSRPRRENSTFIKKVNAHGDSKLHTAVQVTNNDSEVIRLLEQGLPLEVTDNSGWTPLGDAVGHMNIEYVKILLSYGANINHVNDFSETPFLTACSRGWLEGVEYLLEKKAKVQLKDSKGVTGLTYLKDIVRQHEHKEINLDIEQMKELERVISKVESVYSRLGLDINAVSSQTIVEDDSLSLVDPEDDFHERSVINPPSKRQIRQRSPTSSPEPVRRQSIQRAHISSPEPSRKRNIPLSPMSSPDSRTRSQPRSCLRSRTPSPEINKASADYKDVMESLRGKSHRAALQPLSSTCKNSSVRQKRSVSSDLSEWLEDDMNLGKKKLKSDEIVTNASVSSWENRSPTRIINLKKSYDIPSVNTNNSTNLISKEKVKSKQTNEQNIQPKIDQMYEKMSSRPPSPSIPTGVTATIPDVQEHCPVTRIKVKIQSQLLLIPLTRTDLTFAWLAKEAAERFSRTQNSDEPVLRLRTNDGALLDSKDLITQPWMHETHC